MSLVTIKNGPVTLAARWYHGAALGGKAVIFSHGLFSTKDGYKITQLADSITGAGFSLLTFDYRYCGESGGDISDISVMREVDDLSAVVEHVREAGFEEIHLMGSSMGAAVTLLYCGRGGKAASIMTIAAPIDLISIFPAMGMDEALSLEEDGYTDIEGIKIRNTFFRELAQIDIAAALGSIGIPLLAIHGALDRVVPAAQGELLAERYGGKVRYVLVEDGDHNLTRDEDLELIRGEIISWLGGIR